MVDGVLVGSYLKGRESSPLAVSIMRTPASTGVLYVLEIMRRVERVLPISAE